MKNVLFSALALCLALTAAAQTPDNNASGYAFTDVKILPTTPVKDQSRSGTCWCFSTLSFLESEIIKAGGEPMHLSEMWIVRHSFMDKAEKYIRLHGSLNFAEGGASHDVTEGIKAHGIVPFEVYPGLNYGTEKPDFHELSVVLKDYLDGVLKAAESNKPLSTAWKRGFNAILDAYIGDYMRGMADYVFQWFPPFFLGAVYGKVMDMTGWKTGKRWAIVGAGVVVVMYLICSPLGIGA